MGTSTSHASPNTLGWRTVAAAYRNPKIPARRIITEIWRAAKNSPDAQIEKLLTSNDIYSVYKLSDKVRTELGAIKEVSETITGQKTASVITELAKRALINISTGSEKQTNFIKRLFVETTNYYISRDISSFLGSESKSSIKKIVDFKIDLINSVTRKVSSLKEKPANKKEWDRTIKKIITELTKE